MPPADDLRLPSLDALRAFEAAARLGSFERAADELAVTASAIGKRVAALESLIGIELLQRGGKALALTATGRDYLAQVRPALTLLMAVPQHRRPAQRTRKLRVSSPPTATSQPCPSCDWQHSLLGGISVSSRGMRVVVVSSSVSMPNTPKYA